MVHRYTRAGIITRTPNSTDNAELLDAASIATQIASGIWALQPLGQRVMAKAIRSVNAVMDTIHSNEVALPVLQPREAWEQSGRWGEYGEEMMVVTNRQNQQLCLGPTHEEVVSVLASNLRSWQSLPWRVHQVGRKFRDELRPKAGLIRAREFTMKDAYSLDSTEDAMNATYAEFRTAYEEWFEGLGFRTHWIDADNGEIGGLASEELPVMHPEGEHTINGEKALELGHIFLLGDRYTAPMNVRVTDDHNTQQTPLMGCYGIGLSRLISACSVFADDNGWVWPNELAPYSLSVLAARDEDVERAERLAYTIADAGVDVLFDDRTIRLGKRIHDHLLIGSRALTVVGKNFEPDRIVLEWRGGEREELSLTQAIDRLCL